MSVKEPFESTKPWIDLAKVLIWPTVILLFVLIFYSPISGLLRNTVDSGMSVSEVKLGNLEVKLAPIATSEVRPPDEVLAKLLASLTSADIQLLLEWPEGVIDNSACVGPMAPASSPLWGVGKSRLSDNFIQARMREATQMASLVDRKIFSFEIVNGRGYGGDACSAEGSGTVSLTAEGRRIKPFLVQFVSASVKFRHTIK